MERKKSIFSDALILFNTLRLKLRKDCIYNYAASTAFYIFLSIFPFLILLLTIVQYTPITEEFLIIQFEQALPQVISPLIIQIVEEIYGTTSGAAIISVSAILAIWSASKATMSITRGINSAYNIEDKRNYVRVRLMSCIYVLAFAFMIIVALILLVFGRRIYIAIEEVNLPLYGLIHFVLKFRVFLMLVIMALFFTLIYCVMPAKKYKFTEGILGAVICSAAWTILSQILSIYVNKSTSFNYFYGSMTAFILLLLWLYISMYIIFICAEINFYFRRSITLKAADRKRKKIQKYEETQEKKEAKKIPKR